jgi:hypothetical protein
MDLKGVHSGLFRGTILVAQRSYESIGIKGKVVHA